MSHTVEGVYKMIGIDAVSFTDKVKNTASWVRARASTFPTKRVFKGLMLIVATIIGCLVTVLGYIFVYLIALYATGSSLVAAICYFIAVLATLYVS